MNVPNLQSICLDQYANSVQNTKNDPVFLKYSKQEKEANQEYKNLDKNSKQYKKYMKASEELKKAKENFRKAEKLYKEFKSNLSENHESNIQVIRNAAAEERERILELIDPNHENFNQCFECDEIFKKNHFKNCWNLSCEANLNYCTECNAFSDGGFLRICQYCSVPACSNEHHYEHVKECREYSKNNICGFDPEFGTNQGHMFKYWNWLKDRWDEKPEDYYILVEGRIDRELYCNKVTSNVQECRYCGISFCPDCAHIDGYCHRKECVDEQRNPNQRRW